MKRLFWKEWHELRWFLIALVFAPWVVLSPVFTVNMRHNLFAVDVQMLMLVLLFWGPDRMREDAQSNLPISRLQLLSVKLLPGLIAAVLFPNWIRFVAVSKGLSVDYEPLAWLAYAVAMYTVGFAFSLFGSTITSILATWFAVFSSGYIFENLTHNYGLSYRAFAYWWLAVTALLTITGMCLIVKHADVRRKAAAILISFVLAFPTVLFVKNGFNMDMVRRDLNDIFVHKEIPLAPYDGSFSGSIKILASPDRRQFAYAEANGYLDEVKIRDAQGTRTIIERNCTAPVAWLPDGNLLIIASDTALDTQLLEWDHKSGALSNLVQFPNNDKYHQYGMPSIARTIPNPDGTKIALFVEPEKGYSRGLWMLDRKSRKLKLIHPGINLNWYSGSQNISWDSDRLVFIIGNRFWSVRPDGSDFKKLF